MQVDALNLNKMIFPADNQFGIPEIKKEEISIEEITELTPFGVSRSRQGFCHFFLDDYRFERVWNRPRKYLNMLSQFDGALSPDFSIFTDYPRAIQVYNCYRTHWLSAYWQYHGICVIPSMTWSDESSFDFCFEGYESGGVVAVGTVGTAMNQPEEREAFLLGYEEMLDRVKPSGVIAYGEENEYLGDDVKWFQTFAQTRLRKL